MNYKQTSQTEDSPESCLYCPKLCRQACPVSRAEFEEALTPWGKVNLTNWLSQGLVNIEGDAPHFLYQCTSCGLCSTYCPEEIEVRKILAKWRGRIASEHKAPPTITELEQNYLKYQHPWNFNLSDRLKAIPELRLGGGGSLCFFAGSDTINYTPEILPKTINLLQKLGIANVKIIEYPLCTGLSLYEAGFYEEFRQHAQKVTEYLKPFTKIITTSPHVVYALKEIYPLFDLHLEAYVEHALELINRRLQKVKVRFQVSQKSYFYHDPCRLGRYLRLFELPRKLLQMTTDQMIKDFNLNREHSACCGAGNLLTLLAPLTAQHIGQNRLEELYEQQGSVLVTCCPTCIAHFKTCDPTIVVKDLIEILDQTIGV